MQCKQALIAAVLLAGCHTPKMVVKPPCPPTPAVTPARSDVTERAQRASAPNTSTAPTITRWSVLCVEASTGKAYPIPGYRIILHNTNQQPYEISTSTNLIQWITLSNTQTGPLELWDFSQQPEVYWRFRKMPTDEVSPRTDTDNNPLTDANGNVFWLPRPVKTAPKLK